MQEDAPMNTFKFMLAAVGGALVGASAALLYAPRPGEDTRKRLSKRLDREKKVLAKQLERQRQVLMKKGREALDDAADYLSDELHDATKKIVRMVGR
jgi:gas vesicle protein